MQTLSFFRMMKSDIGEEATALERLHEMETLDIIVEMADFQ